MDAERGGRSGDEREDTIDYDYVWSLGGRRVTRWSGLGTIEWAWDMHNYIWTTRCYSITNFIFY